MRIPFNAGAVDVTCKLQTGSWSSLRRPMLGPSSEPSALSFGQAEAELGTRLLHSKWTNSHSHFWLMWNVACVRLLPSLSGGKSFIQACYLSENWSSNNWQILNWLNISLNNRAVENKSAFCFLLKLWPNQATLFGQYNICPNLNYFLSTISGTRLLNELMNSIQQQPLSSPSSSPKQENIFPLFSQHFKCNLNLCICFSC